MSSHVFLKPEVLLKFPLHGRFSENYRDSRGRKPALCARPKGSLGALLKALCPIQKRLLIYGS